MGLRRRWQGTNAAFYPSDFCILPIYHLYLNIPYFTFHPSTSDSVKIPIFAVPNFLPTSKKNVWGFVRPGQPLNRTRAPDPSKI